MLKKQMMTLLALAVVTVYAVPASAGPVRVVGEAIPPPSAIYGETLGETWIRTPKSR